MSLLSTTTSSIPLIEVIIIGILALFLPLLVGYLIALPYWKNIQATANYASIIQCLIIGILFFLFYDYLNDTSVLGIDSLGSDPNAVTTIILSIGCFLVFFILSYFLDHQFSTPGLLVVWALAIMLHSVGEGITIGDNLLAQGIAAVTFVFPIGSFILHKFVEGGVSVRVFDESYRPQLSNVLVLSIIAGLPPVLGVVLEYGGSQFGLSSFGNLEVYLYSAALGAFFYALPKFLSIKDEVSTFTNRQRAFWIIVGFLFMVIFAGASHQIA